MGKPPEVVFVVRHGARLDAADKEWHLTSPTPYDPPLTYGGWNQSRALGNRIGRLLQYREKHGHFPDSPRGQTGVDGATGTRRVDAENSDADNTTEPKTRRKHRIVIHTSPFLRCIQTGIAVSAGIIQEKNNQTLPPPQNRPQSQPFSPNSFRWNSSSPLSQRPDSPQLSPIQEPDDTVADRDKKDISDLDPHNNPRNCLLRLDAFLGEWLSPDYFDQITPPPGSVMMLAGAKVELIRPAESIEATSLLGSKSSRGHFPGGWNAISSSNLTASSASAGTGDGTTGISNHLPDGSLSGPQSENHRNINNNEENTQRLPKLTTSSTVLDRPGYVPPTPTYAISRSDPIPSGYVAHARDACVEIDYQWDSMRAPQDWGNGGEYGEEWSSMHGRFRNGLERMIGWYKANDVQEPKRRPSRAGDSLPIPPGDKNDDNTDTVVILITHGAGCNALIGALTNRPALLDVGMASLTIATRKPDAFVSDGSNTSSHKLKNDDDDGPQKEVADEYKVEMVASTDHLRSGTSPYSTPQTSSSSSPRVLPSPVPSYRPRFASLSGPSSSQLSGFSLGDSAIRNFNQTQNNDVSSNGGRVSHGASRSFSVNRSSPGLWGSSSTPDLADIIIPEFEDPRPPTVRPGSSGVETIFETNDNSGNESIPRRVQSQHGLWGSASLSNDRESHSKRRWTVAERSI